MTEEEARTKWCPFTHKRIMVMLDPSGGEQTIKQAETRAGGCNCIGTACMAWHWDKVPNPARAHPPGGSGPEGSGRCALALASPVQ